MNAYNELTNKMEWRARTHECASVSMSTHTHRQKIAKQKERKEQKRNDMEQNQQQ